MSSVPKRPESIAESQPVITGSGSFHRVFDFLCAAVGLICLSPLFISIAVAVKLGDGGPVFFSQNRIGKGFRPFRLWKFRSMVADADQGVFLTAPADSRITPTGRFLRRYKFDELPQFFNVLAGDMQLVGARPEVDRYVQMFRPEYAVILQDRPGITDPASLAYRHEEQMLLTSRTEQQYLKEILPAKLRISMDYQRRRNFLSDVGILIKTVFGIST